MALVRSESAEMWSMWIRTIGRPAERGPQFDPGYSLGALLATSIVVTLENYVDGIIDIYPEYSLRIGSQVS